MKDKKLLWGMAFILIAAIGAGIGLWGSSMMKERRNIAKPDKNSLVQQPKKGEKTQVTLYYPNRKYLLSGDESLPKLLTVETELAGKEQSLLEAAIKAMQTMPADPAMTAVIRKDLKINSVKLDKGIAYVDFSSQHLYGGSLEEIMLVQGIVRTLTGMQGIQKVQFLIDGQTRETLMGHISIADPIGKEDL